MYSEDVLKRFWEKVDIPKDLDECWEWTAYVDTPGYGGFKLNRRKVNSHVVAWEIFNNQPSPEGLDIMHDCDNKLCVNPNHLEAGTRSKNVKDAIKRGLHAIPKGPFSAEHKLKISKSLRHLQDGEAWLVKKILAESNLTYKEIAKIFKVEPHIISDMSRGRTYTDITYE